MWKYVLKRFAIGFMTVIFSFCITFFLIRFAPGDPVRMLSGKEISNPQLVEQLTVKYGLDKSLPEQFVMYVKNMLKGDFGYSYISDKPVLEIISQRILPTILLSFTSIVISMVLGTLLGLFAAEHRGSAWDKVLCGISYVFDSIPGFWLGLICILVFASWLKLLPTSGMYNVREQYEGYRYVLDVMKYMVLPITTLVAIQTPSYFRVARTSVFQAISQDYVMAFQATGMKKKQIFRKYVLKNAILPVITMFGTSLAFSLGGVTLTETVFSWQGMGRLIIDSIMRRDYPVLMGVYLIISICICITMIITDVIYAFLDPRIRLN
ncbi:peptide/nickel transport system permease protein [Hathewaya proteolytica DSM 3090]|uniref:Peptide/nickel transport system permease protein n=1 Tax=Hathewaya proteolytica DSM 3090 TaxID=1121331 RepID=A0A1M6PKL5_9CLOT|nr:ABC transporter permease [Hathewaya proteolytica]SHK08484.1 peptide/nickel transport system permease protein [Hathewaya proteolytica DSM 3090]